MEKKRDTTATKDPAPQPREVDKLPGDPSAVKEKDYDELVHSVKEPESKDIAAQDPDEAIHLEQSDIPTPGNEIDVDDMLHKRDLHEEDI